MMLRRWAERADLSGRLAAALDMSDAIDKATAQGASAEQIAALAWGHVEVAAMDLCRADPKAAELAARMDREAEAGGPEMEGI
jgi:hypothetical protein